MVTSTTGRNPAMAAPVASPQKPSSEMGGAATRSGQAFSMAANLSRCGLRLKNVPPMRWTRSSSSMISRRASSFASWYFRFRISVVA